LTILPNAEFSPRKSTEPGRDLSKGRVAGNTSRTVKFRVTVAKLTFEGLSELGGCPADFAAPQSCHTVGQVFETLNPFPRQLIAMPWPVFSQFDCCFKCVSSFHAYVWDYTAAFPICFGDWVHWLGKGNGNRKVIVDLVQANLVCATTCSFTYNRCTLQHFEVIAELLPAGKRHG
jgi:hypothetical protein